MMEYPYFFKMKLNNLNLNQGKMIAAAASSIKPKRALSIVSSTTKEFLNDQKSKHHIGASASTTVVSPKNLGDSQQNRPITVDPIKSSAVNKRSHSKNASTLHSSSLSSRGLEHNAPHCVIKAAEKDGMMIDLIQNNYMRDFVRMRHDQDREYFLDNKIRAVKPIFKNFQDNNTNILRSEVCKGKLKTLRERDLDEVEIQ